MLLTYALSTNIIANLRSIKFIANSTAHLCEHLQRINKSNWGSMSSSKNHFHSYLHHCSVWISMEICWIGKERMSCCKGYFVYIILLFCLFSVAKKTKERKYLLWIRKQRWWWKMIYDFCISLHFSHSKMLNTNVRRILMHK
jgi:hypothetical protein